MCWIARDNDGTLFVYNSKPQRLRVNFNLDYHYEDRECMMLNQDEFPEITWENSPVEITNLKQIK